MEINALTSAVGGIHRSMGMMDRSAQRVADGSGDYAEETVAQIVANKSLAANTATVHTYDEMMGELMQMGAQRKGSMGV
ncbi:MAG: hypothetical protein LBP75_05465 [Planctomycetota bacterium]|jgi:flagellar hook protein FlgE|nr:hypothetical protein [Planctomycetota bacterium]